MVIEKECSRQNTCGNYLFCLDGHDYFKRVHTEKSFLTLVKLDQILIVITIFR